MRGRCSPASRPLRAEGLPFDLDRRQVGVTTAPAHRLLWLAAREGDAGRGGEALFHAHFAEGRNLADRAVLIEAGHAGGLPEARVPTLLSGDEDELEIRAAMMQAQVMGIRSVPTFVIDGRYLVQGAQPPGLLAQALLRAGAAAISEWRWGPRPGRPPRLNRLGRRWAPPRDLLRQCPGARPRT